MPALLGCAYAVLLRETLRLSRRGGFGTLAALRRLFSSDAALAVG